jgi:thiol-disulfide isomerase/thioredoxin
MRSLLFSLCLGVLFGTDVHAQERGYIGVLYMDQPEGKIITKVHSGGEAEKAGLKSGDRIVSIDGVRLSDVEKAPPLRGEKGSVVKVGVIRAFSNVEEQVELKRGERPKKKDELTRLPKSVARFAAALKEGKPGPAKKATKQLIEDNFAGQDPGEAIDRFLVRAARYRKRAARAALAELMATERSEPGFSYRVGEALFFLDRHVEASVYLKKALDGMPQDRAMQLGVHHRTQEMLAKSLWDSGQQQESIDLTREIVNFAEKPQLVGRLGMADPTPVEELLIQLPPEEDFEVPLLDGSKWKLSDHRGKPVVLAFWASWCGPCKREIPEIIELRKSRPDWPVEIIALSVDKASDEQKASEMLEKWKINFPAARIGPSSVLSQPDRFNVEGFPSIRIIGAGGGLRVASQGYSSESIDKLAQKVDALLRETPDTGKGFPFGRMWTSGVAKARSIVAIDDVHGISATQNVVAVGLRGTDPVLVPVQDGAVQGGVVAFREKEKRGSQHVVVLAGEPVSAGSRWIRTSKENGEDWFITTPSPIRSMVASGDQLWVAMNKGLVVLDASGKVIHNLDVTVLDLAPAQEGVWAVDGTERMRIGPEGTALMRDKAPGSSQIASDGTWVAGPIEELFVGRFGPEGEARTIAVRKDGTIVGLSGENDAVLRITLDANEGPSIAISDLDGDGRDELLVSSWGRGVATIEMELP